MNDIEFAQNVSLPLADLYEQAKNLGMSTPGYALTYLRAFAETFCEVIDSNIGSDLSLERKIASLRNRQLVDHRVLAHLRTLQKHGNVGAHPKAFGFTTHNYPELFGQSLPAALELLEYLHCVDPARGNLPAYTVTPATQQSLRELSYNAVFEADADARYTLGIHFKEAADILKASETTFRADDGYGFTSRQSIDQATYWLKLAADDSHIAAMYEYGVYLARLEGSQFHDKRQEGERYVWQASDKNHAGALAFIGDCHFYGSARHDQDLPYARELYRQAAEQSHPGALAQLGEMYERGIGGAVDFDAAFQCSLQAAEAGFPQAQFHLYTLHGQGHAFAGDRPAAISWLIEAAEQQYPDAMLELAGLISQTLIRGRTVADAQALYEQCIRSPQTRIKAGYALAHLLAKQATDLSALNLALSYISSCREEIARTAQHQEMLAGCERLGGLIWRQINLTVARTGLHIAPQTQNLPATAPAYIGAPVGRNEPCPCGSKKKYKQCCL